MKRLEHKGTQYAIPESVWEMDLGSFLDLMEILKQPEHLDELGQQMKLAHVVSGVPMSEIEEMDLAAFVRLVELCTFGEEGLKLPDVVKPEEIGLNDRKEPIRFDVDGASYRFQPDFSYQRMRDASRVEDILKGKDLHAHLHYVLALSAWQDGEVFDPETIDAKAMRMCKAKMIDVYRPLFIYALQGKNSTLFMRTFGRADKIKETALSASNRSGDGMA